LAQAIGVPPTRRTWPSAISSATINCTLVIDGVNGRKRRLCWLWSERAKRT
jgi:hypothetical protein